MLKVLATCFLLLHVSLATSNAGAASFIDGRIVGGDDADILDYPYQVSVEYLNSHRCGGAIIARTWILTAGHCVEGLLYPDYFRIRAGTSYRAIGGDIYNVSKIILHSNYSTSTYDNDIALLQLGSPIQLSAHAQIVALPDNEEDVVEGALARVAGWGVTSESGSASTVLQVIEISVFSQAVCRDLYYLYVVSDRMLCAGVWEGGKDACAGDGGSPLVSDSKVIGVVSWGVGCARPQTPGIYANVAALRDWITAETGI